MTDKALEREPVNEPEVAMLRRQLDLEREARQKLEALLEETTRANARANQLSRQLVANAVERERKTRSILEVAAGGIITFDESGAIESFNRAAEEMFGYAAVEVIGKNFNLLLAEPLPEKKPEQPPGPSPDGPARSLAFQGDLLGRRKDQTNFPAEVYLGDLPLPGRRLSLLIMRDISWRKRVEEELRLAKEAAEAASRSKSEFLANMSHEIRTPMNGILGMTQVTLDTDLTREQRQYLELVKSSADALLTVINDILDFSKIEAGRLDLEAIDFALRDRLGDTMKSMALRAHHKKLELACHVAPDVPDHLVGDPGRLGQVVLNLAGNAIKFTDRGEVVVDVATESRTEDAVCLHFRVRDTGIGIPPDKQARIFEPFVQADTSTTRRYGGTGLGLTISTKLVAMMGGRIWLESAVGQGTTFHFTARLGVRQGEPEREALEPVDLHDLPVLVVDDNATNRLILVEMLRRWHMKPTAVAGALEALGALQRAAAAGRPFALVLSDVTMPDVDGFMLAEQIGHHPEYAAPTLMMLSSANQTRETARCRELGIATCLMKPVKQSELLNAIVTALHRASVKPARVDLTRGTERAAPLLPSRPLHILLGEDNATNQTLAIILLEKQGHTVVVAGNGREVLAALEREPFDLVLMDVQMPEMDGFEATARIREKEKGTGGHIPIIAMTAHAMKGDRERCLEAGMDGYVSKPIQARELAQAIARFAPPLAAGRADGADRMGTAEVPQPVAVTAGEAKEPPGQPAAGPLDRAAQLARCGDKEERMRRLINIFLSESAQLMREMREAIASQDSSRLRRSAHSLKGAVGIFGAPAASCAAQKLESMGETGALAGAEAAYTELERVINELRPALAGLTSPPSSGPPS